MLILPIVRASLNGANQRAVVGQLAVHHRQRFQDRTVRQNEVQRLVFGDLQERLVSGVVEVQRGTNVNGSVSRSVRDQHEAVLGQGRSQSVTSGDISHQLSAVRQVQVTDRGRDGAVGIGVGSGQGSISLGRRVTSGHANSSSLSGSSLGSRIGSSGRDGVSFSSVSLSGRVIRSGNDRVSDGLRQGGVQRTHRSGDLAIDIGADDRGTHISGGVTDGDDLQFGSRDLQQVDGVGNQRDGQGRDASNLQL